MGEGDLWNQFGKRLPGFLGITTAQVPSLNRRCLSPAGLRPPKMMPSMGTPSGDSQAGSMMGHWLAGVQNRELGWAQGSSTRERNPLVCDPDRLCPQPRAHDLWRGLTILWLPLLVLPGGDSDAWGQRLVDPFPVNSPVAGLGHIGEDSIPLNGLNGIGIRLH